ncbi:MAG: DUF1553 domain-containing protein [Planctomycetes bacterium]|nr:DUF1553 domain-containing protein [Planctomycetota bacterium]
MLRSRRLPLPILFADLNRVKGFDKRARNGKWAHSSLCLGLVLAAALPAGALPPGEAEKAAVIGQPVSISVRPAMIRLSGPQAMQQVIVTGRYGDGAERDLTPFCALSAEVPDVVTIGPGGFLQPRKDGRTVLVVQAGPRTARVPVVVTDFGQPQPVSFRQQFIAALGVGGCNQGACHGIPSGRGGFRLSLRGHDPDADYLELTRGVFARRTNPLAPEASLIYHKALGRVPHEGGQRFGADTVAARTMLAWLRQGMPNDPPALPALKSLEIVPGPGVRTPPARWQQLAVLAHFSDGSVRDVTRLTVFSSSDDGIARVDGKGLVELRQSGEAAILCRYLDVIQCLRLTYLEPRQDFHWPNPPEHNYVDRHVFAKLKMLNIVPSDLCTDQEFLRRVFLDLCGILPTPEEVRNFLADRRPDRRARLIDRLLERPEFADFWAFKWLDLLRCNRLTIQIKGSHVYRQWLRGHVERNTPWSQVARELLTASGSTFTNPPANYYRGAYNNRAPVAVRDPQTLAEMTAQVFFGVRMQCAQCHNHPYERWTQDDYHHMAAWFAQVKAKADPVQPGSPPPPYPWQLREDAIVIYSARAGEVTQPRTGKVMTPKLLGVPASPLPPGKDRRAVLADLVTAADNPFFARATVNRLWFHLLGKGIVDPPDDFRDSNPPANEALLDALARDFLDHNFDVKHVLRTIVSSRTYQLSAHGNETNQDDERYFSHALVKRKRLPAEVLLDALCTATGVPEKFAGFPLGTRTIQLPDGEVIYTGGRYATWDRHAFLKAFGQPPREASCECEREGDVTVDRVLELKNGAFVRQKIQTPDNRLGKLLARKLPDRDILNELFLATLSRPPLPDEVKAALDHVAKAKVKREAWEDVLWALLNTNEFLLRH